MKRNHRYRVTPRQQKTYRILLAAACRVTGWDPGDDEERLAMHERVIRRRVGTSEMTNDELTQVMDHLKALASPNDLSAQVEDVRHREDPHYARRKQCIHSIEAMANALAAMLVNVRDANAYIRSIARDTHGTRDWRSLPLDAPVHYGRRNRNEAWECDLQTLRKTVAERLQDVLSAIKGTGRRAPRTDIVEGNPLGLVLSRNGRPISNTEIIRDQIIHPKAPAPVTAPEAVIPVHATP
ncbi:hypothetical protein DB346_08650 [Verrucomicrobia bacterium LW23]|nr:hypothetical protein DB346_08650 [Verrucomicrobia bacterium LW23]